MDIPVCPIQWGCVSCPRLNDSVSGGWNYHDWLGVTNVYLLELGMSHSLGYMRMSTPELKQTMENEEDTNRCPPPDSSCPSDRESPPSWLHLTDSFPINSMTHLYLFC